MRIASKYNWYEYSEKYSKIFLNLEKSRAAQSTIRNITKDKTKRACHKRINQKLFDFYNVLIFRKS